MRQQIVLGIGAGLTALVAFVLAAGAVPLHLVVLAVAGLSVTYLVGRAMATDFDRSWLPGLLVAGLAAKLVGAWVRYFVLIEVYGGVGDALGYHSRGLRLAEMFRAFTVPTFEDAGFGSTGTRFVSWFTGLVYTPYQPEPLGGFWLFSLIAFAGTVLFYAAVRRSLPPSTWRRFLIMLMFWPTLLYWPSSVGKEALILGFGGVVTYGAARLFERYRLSWLLVIGAAMAVIGIIRVHVAGLFAGAIVVGMLVSAAPRGAGPKSRRLLLMAAGFAALIPLAALVSREFGIDPSGPLDPSALEPVLSEVARTTGQGGSAVQGGVIRSIADVPAGVLKVLFRPLPYEASNIQMLAASVEGVALLLLILSRTPWMIGNLRRLRRFPYLIFAATFSAGFVVAWSAILNLGIIARQRALVIPFVLTLVAGLGWPLAAGEEPASAAGPDRDAALNPT